MAELRQRKANESAQSGEAAQVPTLSAPTTTADGALLVDAPDKWKKWWTRVFSSLVMIFSFFFIIYLGHFALVAFVVVLEIMVFNEIMTIAHEKLKKAKKADEEVVITSRFLSWFYFFCTSYFVLGKIFLRFEDFWLSYSRVTSFLARHHNVISFSLYSIGFVGFVLSLKKGMYKKQFAQLAWTLTTLLVAVIQGSFHVINIFEGLFWFFLPVAMIVCNDIWAFIFGFFFGRTPLIALSPKKTWEGFIGGMVATWFWGFVFSYVCSQMDLMICPRTEVISSGGHHCTPGPAFILTEYQLPALLSTLLHLVGINKTSVMIYPAQIHTLWLCTFASLIAPFGGFFASGFKRAFKIKDFGESIPGHGGITDRMDCQFIMGIFSFVYINQFVKTIPVDAETLIQSIWSLDVESQKAIFLRLGKFLAAKSAHL